MADQPGFIHLRVHTEYSLVDGVVFVVHAGKTSQSLAKNATQQLKHANAPILGVILNKANVKNSEFHRYYQSY